jgi:ATP adenylyltransferase
MGAAVFLELVYLGGGLRARGLASLGSAKPLQTASSVQLAPLEHSAWKLVEMLTGPKTAPPRHDLPPCRKPPLAKLGKNAVHSRLWGFSSRRPAVIVPNGRRATQVSSEQIWAPWRLDYIAGNKEGPVPAPPASLLPEADPGCFICQAVADPANPLRHVIEHSDRTLTLLNRYPYNNGHLLVAPARHVARLGDLGGEQQWELSQSIARMVAVLERTLKPDGFNIGLNLGRVAGAGLPGHLHWHIVPRWNGDTNFMPVLAGVNVIPQSLDALRVLLLAELAAAS